jgi:hypothetical protein
MIEKVRSIAIVFCPFGKVLEGRLGTHEEPCAGVAGL